MQTEFYAQPRLDFSLFRFASDFSPDCSASDDLCTTSLARSRQEQVQNTEAANKPTGEAENQAILRKTQEDVTSPQE